MCTFCLVTDSTNFVILIIFPVHLSFHAAILFGNLNSLIRGGFRGGGVQGVATPPPNGQSHSIKCSTTNVLRYAQALIYIAKSLVVVVVSSKRVVKPLSKTSCGAA